MKKTLCGLFLCILISNSSVADVNQEINNLKDDIKLIKEIYEKKNK